jgi:hypothetical protein
MGLVGRKESDGHVSGREGVVELLYHERSTIVNVMTITVI